MEERKALMDELKPIMQKKKDGEELSDEELLSISESMVGDNHAIGNEKNIINTRS